MTASQAFEPDLSMWDAWRPAEVARLLGGVDAPWYVAAGWAIDLFLGGQRREHEDLEIAVPRERFGEVATALQGYEFFVPADGLVWPYPTIGDHMQARHQTWVRDPHTGHWRLDVFREPADDDTWICRRDERIRLPYQKLIERTADGIPYACPEVALLFKAKRSELPKNQADFADTLPHLGAARRIWLSESLALVHPDHPWLAKLA